MDRGLAHDQQWDRGRDRNGGWQGTTAQHNDDSEWNNHTFGLSDTDMSTLFERSHPAFRTHRRAWASTVYDQNGVPIDEDGNYIDVDGMFAAGGSLGGQRLAARLPQTF